MSTSGNYIISGGAAGKIRLNILSEVLYDSTRTLLEANGLREGTVFLDAGCGGGNVSRMVAGMIGDTGQVTAIDFDSNIIALNQEEAIAAGTQHLSFETKSAYDIDYDQGFDIAYSRFLLSHLTDPARVLGNLVRSVKPGGRVVVEDVHFSGHFCYPASTAFDRYVSLYMAAARQRGQDPEIGPALYQMFRTAGLENVGFDVIQPVFNKGEGKWMGYVTLDRIKEPVLALALSTETEMEALLEQLEAFTRNPDSIISLPRIFRVWGTKK